MSINREAAEIYLELADLDQRAKKKALAAYEDRPKLLERVNHLLHPGWTEACLDLHETFAENQAIKGFTLVESLGRGRAGTVYRARDHMSKRTVALKLLARTRDPNELLSEIRHRRQIANHPHLMSIYETDATPSGRVFYTMQFMPNGDLGTFTSRSNYRRNPYDVFRWIHQIICALQLVHKHGKAHRDIKPSNIFLDDQHDARLGDFGLTHQVRSTQTQAASEPIPGGTHYFMSLAQWRAMRNSTREPLPTPQQDSQTPEFPLDHRINDCTSLALTFYYLLFGEVLIGERRSCAEVLLDEPALAQQADRFFKRALLPPPQHAFTNADEMLAAIEDVLAHCTRLEAVFSISSLEFKRIELIRQKGRGNYLKRKFEQAYGARDFSEAKRQFDKLAGLDLNLDEERLRLTQWEQELGACELSFETGVQRKKPLEIVAALAKWNGLAKDFDSKVHLEKMKDRLELAQWKRWAKELKLNGGPNGWNDERLKRLIRKTKDADGEPLDGGDLFNLHMKLDRSSADYGLLLRLRAGEKGGDADLGLAEWFPNDMTWKLRWLKRSAALDNQKAAIQLADVYYDNGQMADYKLIRQKFQLSRRWRLRDFTTLGVSALVVILCLLSVYFYLWKRVDHHQDQINASLKRGDVPQALTQVGSLVDIWPGVKIDVERMKYQMMDRLFLVNDPEDWGQFQTLINLDTRFSKRIEDVNNEKNEMEKLSRREAYFNSALKGFWNEREGDVDDQALKGYLTHKYKTDNLPTILKSLEDQIDQLTSSQKGYAKINLSNEAHRRFVQTLFEFTSQPKRGLDALKIAEFNLAEKDPDLNWVSDKLAISGYLEGGSSEQAQLKALKLELSSIANLDFSKNEDLKAFSELIFNTSSALGVGRQIGDLIKINRDLAQKNEKLNQRLTRRDAFWFKVAVQKEEEIGPVDFFDGLALPSNQLVEVYEELVDLRGKEKLWDDLESDRSALKTEKVRFQDSQKAQALLCAKAELIRIKLHDLFDRLGQQPTAPPAIPDLAGWAGNEAANAYDGFRTELLAASEAADPRQSGTESQMQVPEVTNPAESVSGGEDEGPPERP